MIITIRDNNHFNKQFPIPFIHSPTLYIYLYIHTHTHTQYQDY